MDFTPHVALWQLMWNDVWVLILFQHKIFLLHGYVSLTLWAIYVLEHTHMWSVFPFVNYLFPTPVLILLVGRFLGTIIRNFRILLCPILQDYIKESDKLVSLHDEIRDCDSILSQMETLLSGFQVCCSLLHYFAIITFFHLHDDLADCLSHFLTNKWSVPCWHCKSIINFL